MQKRPTQSCKQMILWCFVCQDTFDICWTQDTAHNCPGYESLILPLTKTLLNNSVTWGHSGPGSELCCLTVRSIDAAVLVSAPVYSRAHFTTAQCPFHCQHCLCFASPGVSCLFHPPSCGSPTLWPFWRSGMTAREGSGISPSCRPVAPSPLSCALISLLVCGLY